MKLAAASTPSELEFQFAGGSNLDPAKDTHIHAGRIRLLSKDSMEAEWSAWQNGKPAATKKFHLGRKAGSGDHAAGSH